MSEANPKPAVPLDYGRPARGFGWWRNVRSEFNEHFEGVFEFFGMLIGMLGGARQLVWAIGVGLCAAGLVLALDHGFTHARTYSGLGAFIIGLIVPAPKRH